MVDAKVNTRREQRTRTIIEDVEVQDGVVLTLTAAETQFLADVMRRIGGNPYRSRRRHADDIRRALKAIDVDGDDPRDTEEQNRAIYFTNTTV